MMITVKEMRIIEENAEEIGIGRKLLMENAGSAVAEYIRAKNFFGEVVLFAGTGNKAGDGFVAVRHLLGYGYKAKIILSEREDRIRTEEARTNLEILKKLGNVTILYAENLSDDEISGLLENAAVVIDGLIGTGLRGKPSMQISRLIKLINSSKCFKLAIDIPTGIDPDTGENFGEYVKANAVVTMHRIKKGLVKYKEEIEIVEANIGLPKEIEYYAGRGDAVFFFQEKSPYSKKGDSGRLLIIGGSKIYHGAPILAGLAALRCGVDIVYLYLPEEIARIARSFAAEFIVTPFEGEQLDKNHAEKAKSLIEKADAVLIGNGLGLGCDEGVEKVFDICSELKKPLVVDADALKTEAAKKRRNLQAVYTPHAGEFKILTGKELPNYDKIEERMNLIKEESEKLRVTLLVKGHIDIISDGNRIKITKGGTQAMTVGGTGDVLAGLCAALVARRKLIFESAVVASYINKQAGMLATKEFGNQIKASDLINYIGKLIKEFDPTYHK